MRCLFTVISTIAAAALSFHPGRLLAEEPIVVGVQTALTGDASAFGTDSLHAIIIANELFAGSRFKFISEDDHCSAKGATTAAQRLAAVDKVKYVLGIACNEALLAAAPIYQSRQILVITPGATFGDKKGIGRRTFRLFPPDHLAAEMLYRNIPSSVRRVAILSEENDYPAMMERAFKRLNEQASPPKDLFLESFATGTYDLRPILMRVKTKSPDAIFINVNGEALYIEAVKQIRQLGLKSQIYAVYLPASRVTQQALGQLNEGVLFANLPLIEKSLTPEGRRAYDEFVKRYGPPQSISLMVALAMDSVRILNEALNSGEDPETYIARTTFAGLIGPLGFDKDGAVKGLGFEMQRISNGQVELVPPAAAP